MKRKGLWLAPCILAALSAVLVGCGGTTAPPAVTTPASTTTVPATTAATVKPVTETPQYGGILTISLNTEPTTFDAWNLGGPAVTDQVFEKIWDGDWAKGPAGGYGTKQARWNESTTIRDLKRGYLAESVDWTVDAAAKTVTTKVVVRQGVRFAPTKTDAGKLVNGRQLTADDIAFNITARCNDARAMNYRFFPWIRGLQATKTGPWEVSFTLPMDKAIMGIMFLLDGTLHFAPEVLQKYGNDMGSWNNAVGTGAFQIADYVAGSVVTLDRNASYWQQDPVGPGKGNQLPYLDRLKFLIIPDVSTREAALRTAKLDQMAGFIPEAGQQMKKQVPALVQASGATWSEWPLAMRTDKTPFSDLRVRRALMMAIDFNTINKSLYSGQAQILSWPYWYAVEFADLYLGLDDPAMPASVKELYTYNPDKAKQLLKDGGYPNGFKAEILLLNTTSAIDYYSTIKDMWSKIGVEATLSPREQVALTNIQDRVAYEQMTAAAYPPNASWPEAAELQGVTRSNASLIKDQKVDDAVTHWNITAITDQKAAMAETKELMKYVLDQAWMIPAPRYPQTTLWWPWLKNYSGETTMGWLAAFWPRYVWVDQNLKKSMGY
jgi:peptide/nickel transport system substrate-binding protein